MTTSATLENYTTLTDVTLPRHYSGLNATTDGSVPWRRFATFGLAFQA